METRSAARKPAGLMVCIIRSTAVEGARSSGVVPPCHWRSSGAECAVCSTTSMLAWNGSLETARVFDQAGEGGRVKYGAFQAALEGMTSMESALATFRHHVAELPAMPPLDQSIRWALWLAVAAAGASNCVVRLRLGSGWLAAVARSASKDQSPFD